ncbi:hypothetical protein [Priestia megaterium]|uniref:hypothetical protein n=1 Tax=Priestia megaterium TaxID=1404 RepID=UPI003CC6CE6A
MTNQTTIRQAENVVEITGVLAENRLERIKNNQNVNVITGELDIKTGENEIQTVRIYSAETKKDGSPSAAYTGFQTVMEQYKSLQEVSEEEADKIEIRSGQLGLNEYIGQDDKLKSRPQISTFFVSRVKNGVELTPKAEVTVEAYIQAISTEKDRENEETGRLKLKVIIPIHGGKVIPFEFIAPAGDIADHIDENWEVGQTVTIYADIINKVEVKEIEQKVSFGKPKIKTVTNSTREYIITGGSDPYDEESPKTYTSEIIKKALAEREVQIQEMMEKKNSKNEKPKKKGFGKAAAKTEVKKTEDTDTIDIQDDDLPF